MWDMSPKTPLCTFPTYYLRKQALFITENICIFILKPFIKLGNFFLIQLSTKSQNCRYLKNPIVAMLLWYQKVKNLAVKENGWQE